jgi:cytidylate kinase
VGHNVVCMSTQAGAAAGEVSRRVAEQLGFRLIDEDIVTRAAVEGGVEKEIVADVERRRPALMKLVESFGSAGMGSGYVLAAPAPGQGLPTSDELRGLIRSVIEDVAGAGNAVIVAHAASLALVRRGDVLRVMLTASPEVRERRLADELDCDEKQAARTRKRSDSERADYIKRFYGIGAELPTHYDLVINTDKIGPDQAARLIVQAVQASGERTAEPAA